MPVADSMTMAQALRPQRLPAQWAFEALLIVGGSALIALAAQLSIALPFSPVPITGQTFAVLLIGALFGANRGALTILAYLAEGCAGLPVFAGGSSGVIHLLGPTGGYLVGFIVGACVTGLLAQRGWDRRPHTTAASMAIGYACIFACGLLWLARFIGWPSVVAMGLLPFLPGMAVKISAATLLLPAGWKVLAMLADEEPGKLINEFGVGQGRPFWVPVRSGGEIDSTGRR